MDERDWKLAERFGYLRSEINSKASKEQLERHEKQTEQKIVELERTVDRRILAFERLAETKRNEATVARTEEIEAAYRLGLKEAEARTVKLIAENDARKRKSLWKLLGWVFGTFITGLLAVLLNIGRLWDIFR